MVVLNILGKIEPTCISQKLKLYIANLPNDEMNNWNAHLVKEIETALKLSIAQSEIFEKHYGKSTAKNIKNIVKNTYPYLCVEDMSELECVQHIANEMICLYFDYKYDDMPVGDWTSNCFDGRLCEGDYSEKIAYLIHFICNQYIHDIYPKVPESAPYSIYFSDDFNIRNNYCLLFNGTTDIEQSLKNLTEFGKLLDNFLVEENDFYFLDYLCCELYKIDQSPFTANHCQKLYSLCEFFLEKNNDRELDEKLPPFIKDSYSMDDRKKIAKIARQVRNKVAHGDFSKFREIIEEYASEIMDKNGYLFDYSEYSRQNWAIMNLCFNLLNAIQNLTAAILTDKKSIASIKKQK